MKISKMKRIRMQKNRKRRTIAVSVLFLTVTLLLPGCRKTEENTEVSSEIRDLNRYEDTSLQTRDSSETEEEKESGAEEYDRVSQWPAPTELDEETKMLTHNLIKDMIASYGADPKSEMTENYLGQLEELDPGQGALWRDIMNYWTYANDEMEVNIDELPDNLPEDDSLCIMILGFELYDNGEMQPELIGRLKVALEAAKKYPNAYILCTGGGTSLSNPNVTEADLMGEWLISHGLEEDRLIIENKSMTTAENALNSYAIILSDYPQIDSIAVLSSSYHIAWGSLLLESSFMKAAYENRTPQLHVISNCAYSCTNAKYSDTLRFETGGMMQLIGEEYLAMLYYSGQK